MSLKKLMAGVPSDRLPADGYLYQDREALTSCQHDCSVRVGKTIKLEQEAYLNQHPEVKAMLKLFISKMVRGRKRRNILKEAAEHFIRSPEILDMEVREQLGLPPDGPYVKPDQELFHYEDRNLEIDLKRLIQRHHEKPKPGLELPLPPTPDTLSSSFLSMVTSDTTLPTPEPVKTPPLTLSQHLLILVSNTVDKAIFLHVDDRQLRYDTAYVELLKAVEEAMEIPVTDIKEDIGQLLYYSYKMFELEILEKERIKAERKWENRMRKKLKRTLRLGKNFKGYETPPTPKSDVSSHESYKIPPPRPCVCAPHFNYNRYPKDRFGIYLPVDNEFSMENVTVTPVISNISITTTEKTKSETKTNPTINTKSSTKY